MSQQILITAINTGFWSVWMTVFAEDSGMLLRFVTSFVGTETACFDAEMNPVPRPGGQI